MIQKISFQNYKAFEKGEIKLKPITILLGANSVGKSSIIHFLLMLQQTANSTDYKSALRLHGENISMGECKNIFRNQITSNNIVIDFEFKNENLKELLKKRLLNDFTSQLSQYIQFSFQFSPKEVNESLLKNELNKFINKKGEINKKLYNSKEDFQKLIKVIKYLNNNKSKLKSKKQPNSLGFYYQKYGENFILNNEKLLELYNFLVEVENIKNDLFNLSFELRNVKFKKENVLKMRSVSLMNNNKQILRIKFYLNRSKTEYKNIAIMSNFANGQKLFNSKTKKDFLKLIDFNTTIFSWLRLPRDISRYLYRNKNIYLYNFDSEEYSITTRTLIQIMGQAVVSVKDEFKKQFVNHVNPLRAYPQRYYSLDKANIHTTLNSLDGNSLTEILKENTIVRNKVNTWLKTFKLQVNVSTLQDVIHKLKIRQHSLDLDITDVGFGISQILPVIVQSFLSSEDSLTMIEQPEIHLHPKMQAELADLFIDVTQENLSGKKHLLIETHSEYLLRRLRRRISEGKISAQDVAIYFIAKPKGEKSSAKIQEKKVSENGFFEWPQDFYAKELIEDTTEFLKQSIRKK